MTNTRRVLVVDDEVNMLEILKDLLQFRMPGIQVETASEGQAALALIESWHPDVILSDIKMPKMGGLELLTQMKERKSFAPVILMTGHSDLAAHRKAWELGAFDFLDKPFGEDRLVSTVKTALAFGETFNRARFLGPSPSAKLEGDIMQKLQAHAQRTGTSLDELVAKVLKDVV